VILAIFPPVVIAILRLICRTCKQRVDGGEHLSTAQAQYGCATIAFWHESLGVALWHFRGLGYHTLTSYSFDGELAACVCECSGLHALRGSSSRGGTKGLRLLRAAVKLGITIGLTLDGPKGPHREAKPGIALVAAKNGVPVVPVAMSAAPAWRLRSWDKMCLPKPFSTLQIVFGAPILPPQELSSESLEKFRAAIEFALNELHEILD